MEYVFVFGLAGLLAHLAGVGTMFITWHILLGGRIFEVGSRPLLIGVTSSLLATMLACIAYAAIDIRNLSELYPAMDSSWIDVAARAFLFYVIFSSVQLLLFTLGLIPTTALLLRFRIFSRSSALGIMLLCAAISVASSTGWTQGGDQTLLYRLVAGFALLCLALGPFLISVLLTSSEGDQGGPT